MTIETETKDRRPWSEKLKDTYIYRHEAAAHSWGSCAVGAKLGFPHWRVVEAWVRQPENQEIHHMGLRFPGYVSADSREPALEALGKIERKLTPEKIADFKEFRANYIEEPPIPFF